MSGSLHEMSNACRLLLDVHVSVCACTDAILLKHQSAVHCWQCHSGVTVVSQWCHCRVTVVSQWCRSGVAVVSQWCRSGVTVVSQSHSGITVVSQWCHSGVTVVSQWYHSVVINSVVRAAGWLASRAVQVWSSLQSSNKVQGSTLEAAAAAGTGPWGRGDVPP